MATLKDLVARIHSGGQTGADLGALRAGLALGYIPGESLGGWMPREFRTILGSRPWMHTMYGMREHASSQYGPRTILNVRESDVTVVFGELRESGSKLTVTTAQREKIPCYENPPTPEALRVYLTGLSGSLQRPVKLNVAGNREQGNRGIEAYVYRFLLETFSAPEQLLKSAPWPDPLPKLTLVESRVYPNGDL